MADKPINPVQLATLKALQTGERSAYPGLHLNTLHSLYKRGLVRLRHDRGSFTNPRNGLKFSLTEIGRTYLATLKDQPE